MENGYPERRLAAIVLADVVGYSKLIRADESGIRARFQILQSDLFAPAVTSHGGRIIKTMGDAFLMEFPSAVEAVNCAAKIQTMVAESEKDVPEDRRIRFRIGVNLGDIIIEGDDIHGDGVNIAARLEAIADPGGILISSSVYEQVRYNLSNIGIEFAGRQKVKNIAEPIPTFKILLAADQLGVRPGDNAPRRSFLRPGALAALIVVFLAASGIAGWLMLQSEIDPVAATRIAYKLPDKPSIAVLPFTNMSNDPNQEYFVDGMTEDLITDLAKIESLFIIARNTVFTYKGKSVVVPDVAQELGVRYVLEGSVRRVGDVVRINAQLIDGTTGAHIWAERYDGTLADIFALQDRIIAQVIGQLKITLTLDEENRRNINDTDNPKAYDAYLRGWQLYRRFTPQGFFDAIPDLERAVKLDPDFGRPLATLASIYWLSYRKGMAWAQIVNPALTISDSWIGARDKAESYLRLAMRNPTPLAYQTSSLIWADFRQYGNAIEAAEKAVALDPNDPEGQMAMAWALIFDGRSDAAISNAEAAIRLDPHFPANYRFALGTAQLMIKQFAAAEATLKSAYGLNPDEKEILAPLSIAYAELGKKDDAKSALKKYTDYWITWAPGIETHMVFWPFKRETDIQLFGDGLVKAGLCCEDQLKTYIEKLRRGGTLE